MGNQDANDPIFPGGNSSDRKITIKAARKMLGMVGRNYSDDDIRQVLHILYGMAEEAYETFQDKNGPET